MGMKRYDLVTASTQLRLVEAVNDFLDDHPGWDPQGGLLRIADPLGEEDYYVQAMYKTRKL
jgi:hypothetical protein